MKKVCFIMGLALMCGTVCVKAEDALEREVDEAENKIEMWYKHGSAEREKAEEKLDRILNMPISMNAKIQKIHEAFPNRRPVMKRDYVLDSSVVETTLEESDGPYSTDTTLFHKPLYRQILRSNPSVSDKEALAPWIQSAHDGDVHAMNQLGYFYKVRGQEDESMKWFRDAALHGSREGSFEMGINAEENNNMDLALHYYRLAALRHYAPAEYRLGEIYRDGNTRLGKDLFKSQAWFKEAADQNHKDARAQYKKVHNMIRDVYASEKNYRTAVPPDGAEDANPNK